MDQAEKIRENRMRRMADRQRLRLTKVRRRDPRAHDFGGYYLTDDKNRGINADPWSLDQVEAYLTR